MQQTEKKKRKKVITTALLRRARTRGWTDVQSRSKEIQSRAERFGEIIAIISTNIVIAI